MKHAKALVDHRYNGKVIRVGQVYPIRRTDYQLFEKLGRIELVADPAEVAKPERSLSSYYHTTAMDPEVAEKPVKRPYKRKAKDAE